MLGASVGVGRCLQQRSARSQFTTALRLWHQETFSIAMTGEPSFQGGRSPLEADITSQPNTRNSLILWGASTGMVPDPGFGNIPTPSELGRIYQFVAILGATGHCRDIGELCAHDFSALQVYSGCANRDSYSISSMEGLNVYGRVIH